jgi:hypothetical protein
LDRSCDDAGIRGCAPFVVSGAPSMPCAIRAFPTSFAPWGNLPINFFYH